MRGTESWKAAALAPRDRGLLPASGPCLVWVCPTGRWPRRAGCGPRGRTGPSDLPRTPAPASRLGIGQFMLHRACLQSQGDKTFVRNPGKRKLCGRRRPLGSRPLRGAGARELRVHGVRAKRSPPPPAASWVDAAPEKSQLIHQACVSRSVPRSRGPRLHPCESGIFLMENSPHSARTRASSQELHRVKYRSGICWNTRPNALTLGSVDGRAAL